MMKVLIGCEQFGKNREAFRFLGHDAWSCDIEPARDGSQYHIQGDVLDVLSEGWDLAIFHPPCTYLANSGVRWLHNTPERWLKLFDAADFFNTLLEAPIPRIAIENPIQHKYAKRLIKRHQDQTIQPWQFGHPESKAICLWLKNLPPLEPTNIVTPTNGSAKHKLPPSDDRGILRSEWFDGIALAMAKQWGNVKKLEGQA